MKRLGLNAPEQLVASVHRSADPRATIASMADIVTQAAVESDDVAQNILDRVGHDLAEMVAAVANRLELPSQQLPLAQGGGLLAGSPLLRDCVTIQLTNLGIQAAPVRLVSDPVLGAVKLAQIAADE